MTIKEEIKFLSAIAIIGAVIMVTVANIEYFILVGFPAWQLYR